MSITCAITAGGKATRMHGKTKAFTLINNERIIDSNLKLLRKYFDEIIIISNKPNEFSEYPNLLIYSDHYLNIGPLAGLHSSIVNTQSDFVFIISSDLPFISEQILIELINNSQNSFDATIPRIGRNIEPLFGIYNRNILKKLEHHIENEESKSMKSFLRILNVKYIELEDTEANRRAFTNINSKKDKASASL